MNEVDYKIIFYCSLLGKIDIGVNFLLEGDYKYIYVFDFFNRRFRVAKKVYTLSGFFLLYESVPHAIAPRKNTFFHSKT
jgi:hypothetical protein